ncbi:MAG TPA: ATP-binding protein, partial [Bdellovibrionota bacterium]|nr:ATP-binding protein [Bdellovibrionota bacterium]
LEKVMGQVKKATEIITHLRTFGRAAPATVTRVGLGDVIERSLSLIHEQLRLRQIQVEIGAVNGPEPVVIGNFIQLEQVFINLATNARDAIESAGRGDGQIWIKTRSAGDFAEVLFRDNGCGMDARSKQKVFNPFFTTKEVGKGMGLGMSISYGILNKLHGSIVVESEVGKGAAFLIRIPRDFRELA